MMESQLEFLVHKIQISENAVFVELDTQLLITEAFMKDGLHRQFCNFIITYDEYLRLHLKVGDSIKIGVKRITSRRRQL